MRQMIDVRENVILVVLKLFEPQLEHVACDLLVFGAVILHEGGGHVHVIRASSVLSGLLKDPSGGRSALGPPAKLHVLNVTQRRIDVVDVQIFLVYFVNFIETQMLLFEIGLSEVQQHRLAQHTGCGPLVQLTGLLLEHLGRVHVLVIKHTC